jgi:PAS domain S-box-containing protein
MNLLIVDDQPTDLKLLRAQLESEGHTVFEAHDGVDALALLERQRVDAVISDILMPRMDGYRLCREIRKHARQCNLPIIIYTSTYLSPGDEKLALDMGADKYFKKPVSVEILVAALHEVIAQPHAAPWPDALREIVMLKNYNERLVSKLKEKNTELQAQTKALRASEEHFRTLVETAPEAIYIQINHRFAYVNAATLRLFGATRPDELLGQPVLDRFHPDFRAQVGERMRLLKEGRQPVTSVDEVCLTLAGSPKDVNIAAAPFTFQNQNGSLVFARDITERRKLEAQIRQSRKNAEEVLRKVSRQATDRKKARILLELLIIFGLGTLTYAILKYSNMLQAPFDKFIFGYRNDLDEVFGTLVILLVGFFVFSYRRWRDVKSQVGEQSNIEAALRILHGELEKRIEQRTAELTKSNDALRTEIAGREQMEEALHQSEEQFRAMFELASVGIAQADPRTGQWLRVNRKMCEITGYSAGELLRMHVRDITHAEDRQSDREAFERVMRGESPDYRMEKRYIRKDGALIWVNVNMTVIRDAAGQPTRTVAAIEDITERRKLEDQFRQSQKMEAVGQLAGGVAHDFNNILAIIQMQIGLLNSDGDLSTTQLEYAIGIGEATKRAAALTQQLLLFSRKEILRLSDLDLNQSINNVSKMLRRTISENNEMQFKLALQTTAHPRRPDHGGSSADQSRGQRPRRHAQGRTTLRRNLRRGI